MTQADPPSGEAGDGGETAGGVTPAPSTFPPFVEQFIENQKQELAVRAQEAEVQRMRVANEKAQLENAHTYSMKALDLHAQDRKEERAADASGLSKSLVAVVLVVLAVLGLLGYALYANKDQLIAQIVQALIVGGGGGGLGYAIGTSRGGGRAKGSQTEDP